jgi:hypothetical protein
LGWLIAFQAAPLQLWGYSTAGPATREFSLKIFFRAFNEHSGIHRTACEGRELELDLVVNL